LNTSFIGRENKLANLLWKTPRGTKSLLVTPFTTEEDFEKTVFDAQDILEDIFFLKRQVRGGNKPGIPDIVGIDSDGNVCIVEMKNVTVDSFIIPQVLQYAFWAETNPDSIKSLWFECEKKPDDLPISWDDYEVRIIVIAPDILRSTLDIVDRITYPVDLIEVKRWMDGDNELLLVNKLEQEKKNKVRPVKGIGTYDEEFYRKEYNKNSAEEFLRYTKEVEKIVKEKGWNLEKKYNKHYSSFKAGFFNAFGVRWMGSKTIAFFVMISQDDAEKLQPLFTKYDSSWKEAQYYIDPSKTKTKDFIPIFEHAYQKMSGR
jgi:hypothetical protein